MSTERSRSSIEVIVIEDFAKAGKTPPPGQHYKIRIDKEEYVVEQAELSGKAILALAGKTPEQYSLYERETGNQPRLIAPDEIVSFIKPGVERFLTIPKDPTDG